MSSAQTKQAAKKEENIIIEKAKQQIDDEFKEFGYMPQLRRDGLMWLKTIQHAGSEQRASMLRRLFTVLRHGGLFLQPDPEGKIEKMTKKLKKGKKSKSKDSGKMAAAKKKILAAFASTGGDNVFGEASFSFDKVDIAKIHEDLESTSNVEDVSDDEEDETIEDDVEEDKSEAATTIAPGEKPASNWKWWYETNMPIAASLSHGGRIVIQLPKMKKRPEEPNATHCYRFWRWLLTGNPEGDLTEVVTTSTSGDSALKENCILFRRLGATHGLDQAALYGIDDSQTSDDEDEATQEPKLRGLEEALPCGKKRVIVELKTKGFSFKETKLVGTEDFTLRHHRHWGCNLALGGEGEMTMTGKKIAADGGNGHMYLYHLPPTPTRYGGIMIGVESCEYGKYDPFNFYHGLSAESNPYSPTCGFKWSSKHHTSLADVIPGGGPGKYNGMLVDLTDGWDFLIDKAESFVESFVEETSLPVVSDPKYEEFYATAPRRINRRNSSLARMKKLKQVASATTEGAKTPTKEPNGAQDDDDDDEEPDLSAISRFKKEVSKRANDKSHKKKIVFFGWKSQVEDFQLQFGQVVL